MGKNSMMYCLLKLSRSQFLNFTRQLDSYPVLKHWENLSLIRENVLNLITRVVIFITTKICLHSWYLTSKASLRLLGATTKRRWVTHLTTIFIWRIRHHQSVWSFSKLNATMTSSSLVGMIWLKRQSIY